MGVTTTQEYTSCIPAPRLFKAVFKCMKHRTDVLDINNYYCNTLFEGDVLGDKLESVVHEVKYESSGNGCVVKATNHYHSKPGVVLNLEEINAGEAKAAEEYLLANPTVCA
ncbi:hypothetical protein K2173_026244 [Erythroxylum novogranatense]|uniref:Bet v I/Major latex protein domain-containing protein n=1 Tax=Erythroxylum novogranatense TaxID=1862640 RepID=A0AAV8SC94_9ROSI|nr:hypothetical protein K2173_026244 [Erythroxylum novogranatense]